jgi:adenylate kinase family enzyme
MTNTTESSEIATRPPLGRRIAVLGMTAAGKSTLAKKLARRLGVPHVELDGIVHGPNWVDLSDEEFHTRTADALSGDGWVVDGNYPAVRDLTIGQAETVVWLDYPIVIPLWRVFPRTLRRIIRHEELWNGNRETWRQTLFTRDSMLLWGLTSWRRSRRNTGEALRATPHHARVIVLRTPRDVERLVARARRQHASS